MASNKRLTTFTQRPKNVNSQNYVKNKISNYV